METRILFRGSGAKAFTLIELLVVISIIALLMAILLPTLRSVRETANTLVCATSIRSAGTSIRVYVEDHRNRFPNLAGAEPTNNGGDYWNQMIRGGYLAGSSYQDCKTVVGSSACFDGAKQDYPVGLRMPVFGHNVAMNPADSRTTEDDDVFNSFATPSGVRRYHRLDEVTRASRVFMLAENNKVYGWVYRTFDLDIAQDNRAIFPALRFVPRHRKEGLNFAYFDGHVSFVRGPFVKGGNVFWDNDD